MAALLDGSPLEWKPTTKFGKLIPPHNYIAKPYTQNYDELTLFLVTWNRRGVRDRIPPAENQAAGIYHFDHNRGKGQEGISLVLTQEFKITINDQKLIEVTAARENTWSISTSADDLGKSRGAVGVGSILSIDRAPGSLPGVFNFVDWAVELTYYGFGGWATDGESLGVTYSGGNIVSKDHPSGTLDPGAAVTGVGYFDEMDTSPGVARDILDLKIIDINPKIK